MAYRALAASPATDMAQSRLARQLTRQPDPPQGSRRSRHRAGRRVLRSLGGLDQRSKPNSKLGLGLRRLSTRGDVELFGPRSRARGSRRARLAGG